MARVRVISQGFWAGAMVAALIGAGAAGCGSSNTGPDGGERDGRADDRAVPDQGPADGGDAGPDGPADPGSLVRVTLDGQVGVLLDDFPPASRDRIAQALLAQPESFWVERATQQLRLTSLRLVYRDVFYDEKEMKRSLPLPPEPAWRITLDKKGAQRTTVDGHDLVAVGYHFESTLLSDAASPGISEPALAKIGGTWDEPFVLPVDPTLILQRTGYACMDEDQFPPESVDAENAYQFYDDTCEVEAPGEESCHYSAYPDESCVEAVERVIGRLETALRFERLPWDPKLADEVRSGQVTTPDAPDLAVVTEGHQSLSNHRIIYKYFEPDHCGIVEGCVGAPGWRRLLLFDSIDHNQGGQPLHIGPVDYFNEGLGSELIERNVYEFSACHEHFHFRYYGDFSFGDLPARKNGFCLESTGRLSNNESSPLYTSYNCFNQGVDPGWVDLYAAGLTCNWIDITDLDTSGGPVTDMLRFVSNPDGFLCEGTLVTDDDGNQVWETTQLSTKGGKPVERPVCEVSPGTDGNDEGQVPVTIPQRGGMLTQPCTDPQLLGPRRNCGFTAEKTLRTCTPGQPVTLSCTGASAAQPMVIRVCEASRVLGQGTDCAFQEALGNVVAEDGTVEVTFDCPAARGGAETGGSYALYTAPVFEPDGAAEVTCTE